MKEITSPVKKWPGTVTISDPLSLPQAVMFQHALRESRDKLIQGLEDAGVDVENAKDSDYDKVNLSLSELNVIYIDAILGCVEEWSLDGIENPPKSLPGTPSLSANKLVSWLIKEITTLFQEDEEVPNE